MRISPTFYSAAGELMAPDPLDVKMRSAVPGGRPETEPGFYYDFKFVAETPRQLETKREEFFAYMKTVPGFISLATRDYAVRMDSFVRVGLEVVYAVESPAAASAPLAQAAPQLRRMIDGMAGVR